MSNSPALTVMINAVRKAARALQRDYGELSGLQVSVKGPGDYVTAADKKSDKILREELSKARPGYGFLTEESGAIAGTDPEHRFIIDPIDGTTNFMHAVPIFAVTVALEKKGEIVAGVTYNPISDELYHAEKGQGAFLNNKRLRVAARRELPDSLVSYGIPHRGAKDHALARAEVAAFQGRTAGIRALGSAALELAYLAAGRLDIAMCRDLNIWDIAAGVLLVREAGGFVHDPDSAASPLQTGNMVATNADLMPLVKTMLADARKNA